MKMQRGVALLLVVLMLLSCVGSVAEEVAETGSKDPVATASNMGDKTAAPTELTEENRETTVTLSLPSEEYKNKVDVVFVMDNSTSTKNSGIDFSVEVQNLLNELIAKNPDIELKVGIIKFRGYATDMLETGLTLMTNPAAKKSPTP